MHILTVLPLLTFLLLLLAHPAPTTAQPGIPPRHPQTICNHLFTVPIAAIEPFLAQYDFFLDCYAARHRLPPAGSACTPLWTNGKLPNSKVSIRVCPQAVKDPRVWKDGVGYDCLDVANQVRKLVAECGRDGKVGGKANFGVWERGYVEVMDRDWVPVLRDVFNSKSGN